MNFMIKIILFTVMINLSIGLLTSLPGFNAVPIEAYGGFMNRSDGGVEDAYIIIGELNSTVDVSAGADQGWLNGFLDLVTFNYANKIMNFANRYMFGFVTFVLQPLFGSALGESAGFIFGMIKAMISIVYISTIIWFFTGKNITGE